MANHGSIPEGYTALSDLAESTVAIMCGAWAIAEPTFRTEAGETVTFDDGDGPQEITNPRVTVIRDRIEIPSCLDTAHWRGAYEEIRQLLIDGIMTAYAGHPKTGEHLKVPGDYWAKVVFEPDRGYVPDGREIAFRDGIYHNAADPELEGRALFLLDADAETFKAWLNDNMVLFNETDWPWSQAMAWIYTRSPFVTCLSSHHFKKFGHDEQGAIDGLDVVLFGAAFIHDHYLKNWDDAERELLARLRAGDVSATGKKNGKGERQPVPREFWLDAKGFWNDSQRRMDYAAECNIPGPGQVAWGYLHFPRASVIETWPPRFPLPGKTEQVQPSTAKTLPPKSEVDVFRNGLFVEARAGGRSLSRDAIRDAGLFGCRTTFSSCEKPTASKSR